MKRDLKSTASWSALALGAALGLSSCLDGPKFFKQTGAEQRNTTPDAATVAKEQVVVSSHEENGAATGALSATSTRTQVLQASANSVIAGATVAFPPGALAVDAEITIFPGATLVSDQTLQDLVLDTTVASAATAVTIASNVAIEVGEPFIVTLPVPDASGLQLADPYENLIVLYHVEKVSGDGGFQGLLTRDQIDLKSGFAAVSTRYFGTYQAIITAKRVTVAKEVAATPAIVAEKPIEKAPDPVVAPPTEAPVVAPKAPPGRRYFVRGFQPATFGEDQSVKEGLTGWMTGATPARVGQGTILTKGYVSKAKDERP